jgi:hypothetical protein
MRAAEWRAATEALILVAELDGLYAVRLCGVGSAPGRGEENGLA